jgi:hypothetical protein
MFGRSRFMNAGSSLRNRLPTTTGEAHFFSTPTVASDRSKRPAAAETLSSDA